MYGHLCKNTIQWCKTEYLFPALCSVIITLKLTVIGVFTPKKVPNPTKHGFFFFLEWLLNIYSKRQNSLF